MQERNSTVMDPVFEEALAEFERWRKTRKTGERIPESLWEAAVGLTQRYTISQVSRWLRLNYTELRKRSHGSGKQGLGCSEFIQLDTAEVLSAGECIIEMRRRDGSTMNITFRGAMSCDLLELGKVFWSERS